MKPALAAAALRSVGWAGACTRHLDGLCWLSACFGLVTQLTNGFLLAGRRVPSLLGLAPLFSPGLLSLDQGVVLCQRSGRNMGQPFPAPPGSRLGSCQRKCPCSLLPKPQKAAWPGPRRSATAACSAAAGRLCRSPLKVCQRALRCAAQGSLTSEHLRPLGPFAGHAPSCLPLPPGAGAPLGAGSGEQAHGFGRQASGLGWVPAEGMEQVPSAAASAFPCQRVPLGQPPASWSSAAHGWLSSLGRSHTRCWRRNDGTTLLFRCARSPSGSVFHLWG